MPVVRETVLKLAQLSRLSLTETEVSEMGDSLERILGYVDLLKELDTTDVPPTTDLAGRRMQGREDEVRRGIDAETALLQAPRQSEGGFAVPAFVDEG